MPKIDSIELFRVSMPLVYPFRTAYGNDEVIESVLLRMNSGTSYGWGEGTPWQTPGYSPEFAGGAYVLLRDVIAPLLVGQNIESGQALQQRLGHLKGNYFAKAAADMAWWDLHAKQQDKPLWKVLGGQSDSVDVGADFGVMDSVSELLDTVAGAVEQGFKRVKLKYRPGWDLEMVQAVREQFPDLVFHVDCNSAYRLDALPMFKELDQYGLAMLEQPLGHDDLIDHAKLQREIETPICIDESLTSLDRARKAHEVGACRWFNIKPPRVGGLTNALAIHDFAQSVGIPCWVGGMLESAVGAWHCAALATLPNFKYPADIFPSDRFYRPDLSRPEVELAGPSRVQLPDAVGVGAKPDPVRLEKCTLEHKLIEGS